MQKINIQNKKINFNTNFKGKIVQNNDLIVPLGKNIKNTISELFKRSEREVPEYGIFTPVQESFINSDKSIYAGTITFKIAPSTIKSQPDYQKLRYLQAIVNTPSEVSNSSGMIELGTKENILETLKKDELIEKLQQFITESAEKLKDNNYS